MEKAEKIEKYYSEEHQFKEAIGILRGLALKTNMEETFKWMFPTYMINGKNVIAICKFKNHFGIWFFNGVFLGDPNNVLENAQEGKTLAMRHWKFYAENEVDKTIVLSYINEAIDNEKKGLKLIPKKKIPIKIIIPEELKASLNANTEAKTAFEKLSPYQRKEYSEYISTAKQEKTKASRLQKIIQMIVDGKGLNDKYRK